MKISVIYHSITGNTGKMAGRIVEGARSVEGIEAEAFAVDAIDGEFLDASHCVVLGTPVHFASMSTPVKAWFDTAPRKYKLAGKLAGAFATANYIHGGGEVAIQSVLSHLMVCGMMTYSGGGAFGVPVIHFGPVAIGSKLEEFGELFETYGRRMALQTLSLFGEDGK